jgi:hypothetical protein
MTWKSYAVTAALVLVTTVGLILIVQSYDHIRALVPALR